MELTADEVYRWFYGIARERTRQYKPDVVHVSEVTGCLRRAWYERKYGLVEAHPRLIIYAIGNGLHEALQDYLTRRGWQAEVELSVDAGGFRITGHADLYDPGRNIVVELKTASRLPDKPYRSHLTQLNAYLFMLRARVGFVVYIGKRDGFVRLFRHEWDPQLWRRLLERARILYRAVVEDKPPRPEPGPLCDWCVHRWKCYASRDRERR